MVMMGLCTVAAEQVQGGGLRDSFLVDGVAFKKTFSYAGFEMQPKSYTDPKILLLNIELELKSEKENAEVSSPCKACCECWEMPANPLHHFLWCAVQCHLSICGDFTAPFYALTQICKGKLLLLC